MSSSSQFGSLTTIDGVSPVAGNISFTSSGGTVVITSPGPGTINFEASGGGGGIVTINGNVSSVTGATVTFTGGTSGAVFTGNGTTTMTQSFNFLEIPNTTGSGTAGYISQNGLIAFHNYGTNSTFVGVSAGNQTFTGTGETVGIGFESLKAITTGFRNVMVGQGTGKAITTGDSNIGVGNLALRTITTGIRNIAIGDLAGGSLTADDTANILIGNPGTAGLNTSIRVGFQGLHTSCQLAGVYAGPSPVSTSQSVAISSAGQLSALGAAANGQLVIGATAAAPALGNITSIDNTVTIANGANTIDLSVIAGGGIGTIAGDAGPGATGTTVTLTGGTSGAFYTAAASTVTTTFNYLSMPQTTSSNGQIIIDSLRFMHAYGDNGSVDENTFVGSESGNFTMTGENNTGLGGHALQSLAAGNNNTCVGAFAGGNIISGNDNTSLGADALETTDTGSGNVAVGSSALFSNESGSNNVAVGLSALTALQSAGNNVAIGADALSALVTGDLNIAIGDQAGINYGTNEAGNILIGSKGEAGDGSVLRIGGNPTVTSAYIQGIYNQTGTDDAKAIYVDSDNHISAKVVLGYITKWVDVTGASQSLVPSVGFGANNAGLVTLSLPASATIGSLIQVTGVGAGGWKITQAAGQSIRLGASVSTVGATGFIASTLRGDCVTLRCVVTDTGWQVESSMGNITVS